MHSVIESATPTRERRRAETTRTLVSLARRATAAAGLNGFTIEELCEQGGISRRTFFNYFASKEDAVLGIPLHVDDAEANALFVGMRPRTSAGALSASLLTDLAALIEGRWAALEFDQASARELMAAAEREPRLVTHMLERHHEDEQKDVALVARREGLADDDPRAAAAVQIVGHLARLAVPASLDPDDPRTFAEVLEASLDAAREVFAAQSTPS
jgi:AcrR family transcriptional regulator